MHKILVTHLPFLMGPTLLDIKIDVIVQTAAVASLGLLFAERSNVSLIDKLINQVIGVYLNSSMNIYSENVLIKSQLVWLCS